MEINCREIDIRKCKKCEYYEIHEGEDLCSWNGIFCVDMQKKDCPK